MGQRESSSRPCSIKFHKAIRPNGIFPPEIIVQIISEFEPEDIIPCALSCKLWYETCLSIGKVHQVENNYYEIIQSWPRIRKNIKKGVYRIEVLARHKEMYYEVGEAECHEPSVLPNQIIANFRATSTKEGYAQVTDLTTMKHIKAPYGIVYGNGFILRASLKSKWGPTWHKVEVLDNNFKEINRSFALNRAPPSEGEYIPSNFTMTVNIKFNLDESPRVILHDQVLTEEYSSMMGEKPTISIEEFDLTTGNFTRWLYVKGRGVAWYCGDIVAVQTGNQGLHWMNTIECIDLRTKKVVITYGPDSYTYVHKNRLGVYENNKVKFYDLPSFKKVSELDLTPVTDATEYFHYNHEPSEYIHFGFDDVKLVCRARGQLAIFDLETGNLLLQFESPLKEPLSRVHNTYICRFYFPSKQHIAVDLNGFLTLYDFGNAAK